MYRLSYLFSNVFKRVCLEVFSCFSNIWLQQIIYLLLIFYFILLKTFIILGNYDLHLGIKMFIYM